MAEGRVEHALARLSRAGRNKDWELVLSLLAEDWGEIYQHRPVALLKAIDGLPDHVIEANSRLRLARTHIERNLRQEPEGTAFQDVLRGGTTGQPIDHLAALTGRIATARSSGRHAEALAATDRAIAYLRTVPVEIVATMSNALPEFHYHWGVTLMHANRLADALDQFTKSYDWAASTSHQMMMTSAAGGAAFIHALHGRGRDVALWLERVPPVPASAWWSPFAGTAAKLADAITQLDHLDREAAARRISEIDISLSREFWAPFFAIRAVLTPDRPGPGQALLAEFEAFLASIPPEHGDVPFNSDLTAIVRYLLLLTIHQPERALDALQPEQQRPAGGLFRQLGVLHYARRLLQINRPRHARRLALPLFGASDARPRVLVSALLIAAETSTDGRSEEHYHRAVALATWAHLYSPFAETPGNVRNAAAAEFANGGAELVAERLRVTRDRPQVSGFDSLTPREAAVIRAVLAGLSNGEIASLHQVSINTVKAQLRTAYRKLDVSTRQQVLERFDVR